MQSTVAKMHKLLDERDVLVGDISSMDFDAPSSPITEGIEIVGKLEVCCPQVEGMRRIVEANKAGIGDFESAQNLKDAIDRAPEECVPFFTLRPAADQHNRHGHFGKADAKCKRIPHDSPLADTKAESFMAHSPQICFRGVSSNSEALNSIFLNGLQRR